MNNGESSYRRFLDGDESGLVEIIRDYKDGLILYLNSFVGDIRTAEELCEDTFVKLGVKRPKFRTSAEDHPQDSRGDGTARFKTWLYAIARNTAIDYLRRASRNRTVSIDECAEISADEAMLEESYIREERRITVHRIMARLKPEYRQVLWLIYFEELSNRETAAVMKKSVHGIETLVYRARLALKHELEKEKFLYEEL